jgi:bacteriocin leader peptide (microcyclamide/patellamide family)
MDKKKLVSQSAQPVTNLIPYLPSELAELSEEDLSQVRGGWINPGDIPVLEAPVELCCWCWAPDPDIYTASESTVNIVAFNIE